MSGPELVVPDTLSRDAVTKPLCQQCYQEMDNVYLLQCAENVESEMVSAGIKDQESQPADSLEPRARRALTDYAMSEEENLEASQNMQKLQKL